MGVVDLKTPMSILGNLKIYKELDFEIIRNINKYKKRNTDRIIKTIRQLKKYQNNFFCVWWSWDLKRTKNLIRTNINISFF